MKRLPGFTLIEMAIVMAVAAALAVVTGATLVHAQRNAGAGATAYEISLRFQGLKTRALQEQRDYAAVFINPDQDDGSNCRSGSAVNCTRMIVLSAPPGNWTLDGFDPRTPGLVIDDDVWFDRPIVLDTGAAGAAAAAPFATITQLPTPMQAGCKASPTVTTKCYAIRFGADGTVGPIYPGAAPASPPDGISLGITTDAQRQLLRSHRRAVLITFPTGIIRTYAY